MSEYRHFQLFSLLDRTRKALQPWAGEVPVAEWQREIDAQMERISANRFRVAIVGEFNRGKSSLINTLLQKEILPADVIPTTATFNRVVYGAEPKAYLIFRDGTTRAVPIEEMESSITRLTEESEETARTVSEAVVEYPSMFCSNHVELIDTPGLNDNDELTEMTISRLQDIDLAIVTVSAVFSFSESEAKFVAKLVETSSVGDILFAVTMTDKVDEKGHDRLRANLEKLIREKVLAELQAAHDAGDPVMEKYSRLVSDPRMYFLSARTAQQALALQNEEMYIKSGYRQFTEDLPGILLEGQRRSMEDEPIRVEKQVLNGFSDYAGSYSRLAAAAEALKAFKKWFAETAYSLADRGDLRGLESSAWHKTVKDAGDSVIRRREENEKRIRQAWSDADETPEARTLAVLKTLPETYADFNDAIAAAFHAGLAEEWKKESDRCFNEALVSQVSLPDMPDVRDGVLELCKSAIPDWTDQNIAFEPELFRWCQSPVDTVSDPVSEAFIDACVGAAEASLNNCIRSNNAKLEKILSALADSRKKQIESMVRRVFALVSKEEKTVNEKMEAAAKVVIAPEQLRAFSQLMEECLAVEAG